MSRGSWPRRSCSSRPPCRPSPKSQSSWAGAATVALELNKLPEAVKYLEAATKEDPKSKVYFNNLGNAYSALGQKDKAEAAYRAALALDKTYFDAHFNLANLKAAQGAFDVAFNEYTRAVAVKPDDPEVHLNFGYVLRKSGDREKAIREYALAAKLQPERLETQMSLGALLLEAKHDADAVEVYTKLLEQDPNKGEARLGLGTALYNLGKFPEAVAELTKAAQVLPQSFEAQYNLALALTAAKNPAAAEEAYQAALALRPNNANCLNNLGALQFDQGKFKEAADTFEKAKAANPQLELAYVNRARALAKAGMRPSAVQEWETMTHLFPKGEQGHLGLADAYYDDGDGVKALREYQLVVEINPANAAAQNNAGLIWLGRHTTDPQRPGDGGEVLPRGAGGQARFRSGAQQSRRGLPVPGAARQGPRAVPESPGRRPQLRPRQEEP